MSDEWVRIDQAFVEHATVPVMTDTYGGDLAPGDENRYAMRLSQGSDGVVLYGTVEDFQRFADKIRERY